MAFSGKEGNPGIYFNEFNQFKKCYSITINGDRIILQGPVVQRAISLTLG